LPQPYQGVAYAEMVATEEPFEERVIRAIFEDEDFRNIQRSVLFEVYLLACEAHKRKFTLSDRKLFRVADALIAKHGRKIERAEIAGAGGGYMESRTVDGAARPYYLGFPVMLTQKLPLITATLTGKIMLAYRRYVSRRGTRRAPTDHGGALAGSLFRSGSDRGVGNRAVRRGHPRRRRQCQFRSARCPRRSISGGCHAPSLVSWLSLCASGVLVFSLVDKT
jgi:hypothetical protein